MFTGLKPYPELAAHNGVHSDVVPRHWTWRRIKSLTKLNPSRSEAREDIASGAEATFLPMEAVSSLGRVDYSRRIDPSMSAAGFTYFREGDVLVAKITPCFENGKGACLEELSTSFGLGSTEFHVLRAGTEIAPKFLEAVTRTWRFRRLGADAMTGSAGQQRVPPEFIGSYAVALPPRAEQEQIVTFLSHANARIDQSIAAKRKMISLLEEQYQAFVSQSFTGGLDSGIPRTESGYPWIGDLPRHWDVLSCSRVVSLVTSGSRAWSDYYSDDGLIFIQSGNLGRSMELNLSRIQYVRPPQGAEGERTRVRRDDILVCITGSLTGNVVFVDQDLNFPAFVNQHVALVRPKPQSVIPKFLALVLHSEIGRGQFKICEYGGTKQGLGLADVKSILVPIPPVSEQQRILEDVAWEKDRIASLKHRAVAEIELLREFRTRLTSDVVTGQLDVREAASKLPDLDPAELATADVDDSDAFNAVAEEFLDEDEP